MNHRLRNSCVASVCAAIFILVCCETALAQQGSSKFKEGDRVQVKEGFKWTTGTVTKIEDHAGWVTVRLDHVEFGDQLPDEMRERMRTRTFPPDEVRPAKAAKAEKAVAPSSLRKWTDRTGKFSVDAQFGGTDGPKVVLVKADGKKLAVPIDKLSDADQAYIKEQTDPAENPFADIAAATPVVPESAPKETNWKDAKTVQPQKFVHWTFVPPAEVGAMLKPASPSTTSVPLAPVADASSEYAEIAGIYPASDGSRVWVCRQKGIMPGDKQYVEAIDVANGKSAGMTALPNRTKLMDADPDDGLVLYQSVGKGGDDWKDSEKGALTIAQLSPGKITPIAKWEPYESMGHGTDEIRKARFLTAKRVLTLDEIGTAVVIWDVESMKAVFKIPVGQGGLHTTSLSPNRKLLAISGAAGIFIVDLEAGRHVATIPSDGAWYNSLAFRGDNGRLAGIANMTVKVWDLADGKEAVKLNAPLIMPDDEALQWTGKYLLVNHCFLYDVDRRVILWEYQEPTSFSHHSVLRDGRLWIMPPGRDEHRLITAPLPHASAIAMAERLPSAEELLVAKAGDAVSIEVDVDPGIVLSSDVQKSMAEKVQSIEGDKNDNEKIVLLKPGDAKNDLIKESLAAALRKAGYQVVEHSDLVLRAVCKGQRQQTIRINVDGRWPVRPEDIVTRTITPHATYLAFMRNGQPLWRFGYLAEPNNIIELRRGETLEQALVRLSQPDIGVFSHIMFSSPIARPGTASEEGAYGVSRFSGRGIEDVVTEQNTEGAKAQKSG